MNSRRCQKILQAKYVSVCAEELTFGGWSTVTREGYQELLEF